jgi:uncharacterized protein YrrD
MLVLGSQLIGVPVMGLQTGTKLAQTKSPIIDPANLKIVAYIVEGPLLSEKPSFLRTADIREQGDVGMIIDSSDEFIGVDDVIKIKELYDLGFNLDGTSVIDETNHKLGKVEDYSLEITSFDVTQLNVKRGVFKGLTDTGLLVHRSQIVEINNENIIVRTTAEKIEPVMQSERRTFVNPFKSANPQINNKDV